MEVDRLCGKKRRTDSKETEAEGETEGGFEREHARWGGRRRVSLEEGRGVENEGEEVLCQSHSATFCLIFNHILPHFQSYSASFSTPLIQPAH
jgi:hypothetical protein